MQLQTLNPHIKTLLIGLYIGVLTAALSPIIGIAWYSLPFHGSAFLQASTVLSVAIAFFIEEYIRKMNRPLNTRVGIAIATAVVAVGGYYFFLLWALRGFGN